MTEIHTQHIYQIVRNFPFIDQLTKPFVFSRIYGIFHLWVSYTCCCWSQIILLYCFLMRDSILMVFITYFILCVQIIDCKTQLNFSNSEIGLMAKWRKRKFFFDFVFLVSFRNWAWSVQCIQEFFGRVIFEIGEVEFGQINL